MKLSSQMVTKSLDELVDLKFLMILALLRRWGGREGGRREGVK